MIEDRGVKKKKKKKDTVDTRECNSFCVLPFSRDKDEEKIRAPSRIDIPASLLFEGFGSTSARFRRKESKDLLEYVRTRGDGRDPSRTSPFLSRERAEGEGTESRGCKYLPPHS